MNYPFVSIIMPIRNEKNFIEKSLTAVLNQDYPIDKMEIIVVDGCSCDGTKEIATKCMAKNPKFKIFLLDNHSKIVPTALNIGLRQAKGDVIIRVDGHCEIAKDYVRRCIEVLQETGADCVGGLQRAVGHRWMGRVIALATSSPFGVGNARFHYDERPGWVDTVYLGAYRREVFDRIGGFDEELVRNQDDEFNFRLTQAGGKIWLDPSILSIYYSRSNLKDLWKQYFQYGYWKVRVFQKRGAIASLRQIIPAIFVLALLGSLILSLITHNIFYFLTIFAPYIILNLLFTLWIARKEPFTLFLLPLCFLTLHLSYGLGFLFGLFVWRRYGFRFLVIKNLKRSG
ncbi:MAG: glycosyltransferase family 2 protein [Candidatus Omnitrophica bacterium]|nr:glycosyltransferase family 2 protein [Candidatus Omnitrophota bacterium]